MQTDGSKNRQFKLASGMTAPDFKGQNWDGQTVTLSALLRRKVWLAFFRYASCPLCNLRIHEMIKNYKALSDAGLSIIAVFQSPSESIAEYVGKQKPPFPLISDPDEDLYSLFGLTFSKSGFIHPGNLPVFSKALVQGFLPGKVEGTITRLPADFLIDEGGSFSRVFYGDKISDHISFDEVFRFLED